MGQSLFLIDDVSCLREKIAGLDGPLAQFWESIAGFTRNRPGISWMLAPFTAVVTGRDADIALARQSMVDYCRRLPGRSLSTDVQEHFWCPSFQVARMGIYYSWLRELGYIDGREAAVCEQNLLDYCFAHQYTSGLTKHHTDVKNNQTLSLSFGCTTLGHILGYRLSSSPTARTIMAEGLKHLRTRISNYPAGGWGGEGSTYQTLIVGPGVSLASLALEAITGADVFFRRSGPEFASPAEVALMSHRCIMPDGLMLPWDNYGFFVSQISLTSAVLARKTGDASYVNWVNAQRLFKPYIHFGWGRDEKMLTLLFWPESANCSTERAFSSWSAPIVGAEYVSPDERVAFMQMCDEHGAGSEVGRPQCNPNHVVYTAYGAQLFSDGMGSAFRFPSCTKEVPHISGMQRIDWSGGGPGAHSCILIDGQEDYIPTERAHGQVTAFADLGEAALLATESAASYQPTYDVTSVRRTSALLAGGRALIIRDDVQAESPHTYQTRFFVRPTLQEMPAQEGRPYFVIDTPERVRFHLLPLEQAQVVRRVREGFPREFEGRSAQLDFLHPNSGTTSSFSLLVIAEDQVEPLEDVTDGWQVYGGPTREEQEPRGKTVPVDTCLAALDGIQRDRVVSLRKTLPLAAGREVCLQLSRGLRSCPVLVNGQPIDVELPERFRPADDTPGATRVTKDLLQPWLTLQTAGGSAGLCEVTVVFERLPGSDHIYADLPDDSFLQGYGPATLGTARLESFAPWVDFVEGRLTVSGLRGESLEANLDTMAEGQLIAASAAGTAYLQSPSQAGAFQASRPLNISLTADTIRLGDLGEPFYLTIERYDAPVEIDWHGGTLQVVYRGKQELALSFATTDLLALIINGDFTDAGTAPAREIRLTGHPAVTEQPYQQDEAMRWAFDTGAPADTLIALLTHEHWEVRMAAANALGQRREASAREALLALLAEERDEEIFENKQEYFWFVRGLDPQFAGDNCLLRREDNPRKFDAWNRRWRLKGQVARALGHIGGPGVEEALLASLSDQQDFHYYVCVCDALIECGTERSLPRLRQFLDYDEWNTQRSSEEAIAAIEARRGTAVPDNA
ncbi:MAG: HEAT repeat domain-containing protein [Armatimonadota bacterium]